MDPRPPVDPRIARFLPPLLLIGLIILAMGGVVQNLWVQDDTGIIQHNDLVHSLSGVWRAFGQPYWPPGERAELYRPLAIAFFTIQWAIAEGSPWVFRVVNLLTYAASVLAVWTLLRRLAPAPAAWVGAALFAVHPVHVEAVAVSVNQGETMVAALLCWAAVQYLDWRTGTIPAPQAKATILGIYIVGLFIKEHALILPGLFLALELSVLRVGPSWRTRLREVGPVYLALLGVGALFWTLRGTILGPGSGTAPIETLHNLSLLGRAATMLGVIPEWIRLLVWPAHLQMEWSPLEYVPFVAWSLRETVGVIGLGSLLLALGLSWGRRPRITLALLWLAVALFPVSNLLVVTGVMIAERTLFLPSVAVAIIAADLMALAAETPVLTRRPARTVVLTVLGLLIGLGMVASALRMLTWRNRVLFLASAVVDAPLSYRTHLSYGVMLHEGGEPEAGDSALRRAVALHRYEIAPFLRIAWKLQHETGSCRPAMTLYGLMIDIAPGRGDLRTGYVACATWLGHYGPAAAAARNGIDAGIDADYWRRALPVIERAAADHAPAGTVRLPHLPGEWVDIGPPDPTR